MTEASRNPENLTPDEMRQGIKNKGVSRMLAISIVLAISALAIVYLIVI